MMNVACSNMASTASKTNPKYTGVTTGWTDNARGVWGGQLSCSGKNITDQRMVSKDGAVIPYLRTHNLDEWLGIVDPNNVTASVDGDTVQDVLADMNKYISYTGKTMKTPPAVKKVVMRYQNAFVGLLAGTTRQVAPANFSYQTYSDECPRNVLLVFTPDGAYAHVDGVGSKPLLANELKGEGILENKWFQVEESGTAVGHAMMHDDSSAGIRNKTKSVEIGVKGSGARANRMLIMSVPLKQKPHSMSDKGDGECIVYKPHSMSDKSDDDEGIVYRGLSATGPPVGKARAARLSVGMTYGEEGVRKQELEYDDSEAIVITQIDYNTLSLEKDADTVAVGDDAVEFAIRDMERQYGMCDATCNLSELPAMLHKFEKEHMDLIEMTFEAVAKKDPFTPTANALAAFE